MLPAAAVVGEVQAAAGAVVALAAAAVVLVALAAVVALVGVAPAAVGEACNVLFATGRMRFGPRSASIRTSGTE